MSPIIGAAWLLLLVPVLHDLPVFSVPVLQAQSVRAAGLVIKPDSTPVSGARIVLHRVSRAAQGPLDSTTSDARGRFRLTFRADTGALYLLSARHQGIEYFSPPVHSSPERPDTAIRIVVSDTSATAPVALVARHLVLTRPGPDGSRSVLDLLVLRNEGQRTRVAPDSVHPSWSGPLPSGTLGLELGEGDISPDAVSRRRDSLIITAPVSPGEKQLTVQYLVPSGRASLELSFPDSVVSVNVLAEENDVRVSGGSLSPADSQVIQGRSFRRWTGDVPAGGVVRVALPGIRGTPTWVLVVLVSVVVAVLAGTGWRYLGRRAAVPVPFSAEELLESIARLDARYLGQEYDQAGPDWASYQAERARLKAQLEASLAARRQSL